MISRAGVPALLAWCALLPAAPDAATTELRPETLRAFGEYIAAREASLRRERLEGPRFLWVDDSEERLRRVRSGEVVIEPVQGKGIVEVKSGLIHDWRAAAFIPGTTLARTLDLVKNYDNHKNVYQPEVTDSKLRKRNGNDYQIYMRVLKKKVLTVTLNTEHDVRYFPLDARREHSRSYSTRIAEVEDAGAANEREKPPGKDHGFLWRLNSYWRFQERDGGVYIECEAISLTRAIPFGLGWAVTPIVRDLPHESLAHTLSATRKALAAN